MSQPLSKEEHDVEVELEKRIINDFNYHAPTPDMLPKFGELRTLCRGLALKIAELVPAGRERCIALTRLEEVMMHANSGIARKGPIA